MNIVGDNFLQVYENGTHGSNDWKYYGNTLMYAIDKTGAAGYGAAYIELVFLDTDDFGDSVYDELHDEVIAVNQYPSSQSSWTPQDYVNYFKNYLQGLANRGVLRDWTMYKFCFEDPTIDDFRNRPASVYIEYPAGTIVLASTASPHPDFHGTHIRMTLNYIGGYPNLSIFRGGTDFDTSVAGYVLSANNYPCFWRYDTTGAMSDYLLGDQEPGPVPPGDPSMYEDDPITASDAYNNIIANFLTNFTVLAEIDGTNLNRIAQALNNNITLEDSIPEMLAKIARSLVQKNIAEGILSIKIVPIPNGKTLPYKTGIAERLFDPIGIDPVQGKKLNNTIKKYHIGSMGVHRVFNDYRDFLCEYSIYLPFSGIHQLDADVIVGNTLNIYSDIDFLTGSILYHLIVDNGTYSRDIYTFTGDCAIELPITGNDYSAKYEAVVNGIFSGVGMIAGAAAGGPVGAMAGAGGASALTAGLKTIGNAATVKGNYMQSGKLVPNSCALSVLYPYLIVSTPQDVSPDYTSVKGRPTHKMLKLSLLSGFAIVSNINLDSIAYATDEDKEALRSLLANGVYF